jgi:hypothetical protein
MLRPILFKQGRKGAELLKKIEFLLLFFLILCNLKKYYTFPRHADTDNKISMSLKCLQRVKFSRGSDFFLSDRIFPPDWPESFAKSWQQCPG